MTQDIEELRKAVELFGGAVVCAVPMDFQDASNFREVPDNQEVYVSMTDGNDTSIIFDIAQRVEAPSGPSDMDAVDYHFKDVAVDQDRTTKIWNKRPISAPHHSDKPAYQVIGTVSARPTEQPTDPPTFIAIIMTILRLKEQTADIVITVNIPFDNPEIVRSEKCIASPTYTGGDIDPASGVKSALLEYGMKVSQDLVNAFQILDFGLFCEDPVE
ncbi:uncharacterized protein H6S33_012546 [Morchella sextelata]|uniref:uncharacterized protein n=1 Tax=Morchella sextelata TaxID=1174677 RepID=UPI001D04AC53|nr:uncharacterized protein H6S33_012546 [Morchella sextelata]KAH0610000.1 hypothetical protein H6S33_012546 [Morchella sextelata]